MIRRRERLPGSRRMLLLEQGEATTCDVTGRNATSNQQYRAQQSRKDSPAACGAQQNLKPRRSHRRRRPLLRAMVEK